MQVLGEKSYKSIVLHIILFVVSIFACVYFGNLCFRYYEALFVTKDLSVVAELGVLMDKFTFGSIRMGFYVSPEIIVFVSLFLQVECLITISKRMTQPYGLIEYDEKGFYLNMPFNKTWFVSFEEVTGIRVSMFEGPVHVKKRNANWFFYDPDDYIEINTARMLKGKTTGTITVAINDKIFKMSGVKNALPVARKMQVICNDGRRKRFEWLDEKAQEKREKELREKTKT